MNYIVEIENHQLEIPEWVNWIAQDKNGYWYSYSTIPELGSNQWYIDAVKEDISMSDSNGIVLRFFESSYPWYLNCYEITSP